MEGSAGRGSGSASAASSASASGASAASASVVVGIGSNFFGQLGPPLLPGMGAAAGAGDREEEEEESDEAEVPVWCAREIGGLAEAAGGDVGHVAEVECGANFCVARVHKTAGRGGQMIVWGAQVLSGGGDGNGEGEGEGEGDEKDFCRPRVLEVRLPLRCEQVSCGNKHTLALMEGGHVVSWGAGYFGQCGHGTETQQASPRLVDSLVPHRLGGQAVVQVAAGGNHSGVLCDSGQMFMWGLNRRGQCGTDHDMEAIMHPYPVIDDNLGPETGAPTQMVCGQNHSALLTSHGWVFTWGSASNGALGLTRTVKYVARPTAIPLFRDQPARMLATGDSHMLVLTHAGEIFSWGFGTEGQTGHGSALHLRTPRRISFEPSAPIVDIACGSYWSTAVAQDGTAYVWGYGDGGWLGVPFPNKAERDRIPEVEPGPSRQRYGITRCFDSRLNVHQPIRCTALAHLHVTKISCGRGHMIAHGQLRQGVPASYFSDPTHRRAMLRELREIGVFGAAAGSLQHLRSSGSRSDSTGSMQSSSAAVGATNDNTQQQLSGGAAEDGVGGDGGRGGGGGGGGTSGSSEPPPSEVTAMREQWRKSSSNVSNENEQASMREMKRQLLSFCRHNKLRAVKDMIRSFPALLSARDDLGNTALLVAAQNGHSDLCHALVDAGANVNESNDKGNGALHFCFAYGFKTLALELINRGADEYRTNNDGLTPYEGLAEADLERI